MTFIKTIGLSLVSLLGLNACVATNNTDYSNSSSYNTYTPKYTPKPPSTRGFLSEKWFLTKINHSPYQGKRITLNISADKKVSGFSGCNRYFVSNVDVRGSRLKFGTVGSTRMFCVDSRSNNLEKKYLTVLRGVSRFQRSESRLVLEGSSGSLVFYKKSRR